MLVVEVDGNSHDNRVAYDANRTDILNDLGLIVFRYRNEEVYENLAVLADDLKQRIKKRKRKFLP